MPADKCMAQTRGHIYRCFYADALPVIVSACITAHPYEPFFHTVLPFYHPAHNKIGATNQHYTNGGILHYGTCQFYFSPLLPEKIKQGDCKKYMYLVKQYSYRLQQRHFP